MLCFFFRGILAALDLGSSQLPPSYLRLTTTANICKKFQFFKTFLQVFALRATFFAIFVLKSLREKKHSLHKFSFYKYPDISFHEF